MTVSVRLPESTEIQLSSYCQAHRISKSEAIKQALDLFLAGHAQQTTPYELGKDGFGADRSHAGKRAENTKRLLREKFLGKIDR
ncbi:MAG: hypothetical protein ACRERV_02870 [Methylococcales bacterium]